MLVSSPLTTLLVTAAAVNSAMALDESGAVGVTGLVGTRAELPCHFSPRSAGDKPKLILWYKTGVSRPLFSHDSRVPQVQADLRQAGGELRLGAGSASLEYHNLTALHAGLYECRVDFYTSPAHTSLVNLTVVVPVRRVEILGTWSVGRGSGSPDHGSWSPGRGSWSPGRGSWSPAHGSWGVLGPYYPGQTINITCVSHQGWPPPVLTWWVGEKMLKSSRLEETTTGTVQNDLVIENASRSWHDQTLTCTANNTRLAAPAASSVLIRMFLMPTSVVVENPGPVVEGRQTHFRCLATGAQPAPTLAWTLNGTHIRALQSVSEGRVTWSTLLVNVTRAHNNVSVVCTATNPALRGQRLSNSTYITVYYPPSVSLSLGRSLKPESLKENDDVYFTCTVSASPPASAITWFHQGRVMTQNVSTGVVMSGDSLVLQGVRRHQAGQYRCGAVNPLARVVSSPALLRIKYKPECLTSLTTYFIYDKPVNITCTVTSHPPVTSIHWQWKNNDDAITTPVTGRRTEVTSAQLTVRPYPGGEDRTLSCWGVNDMGAQLQPCKFSIKEVAVPQSSCRVANISTTSLSLACHTPHLDPQPSTLYTAEVYFDNRTLFANVTSTRPNFNVSRLDAGTSYQIKVYVTHGPVTSQPVVVSAYTSRSSITPPDGAGEVGEVVGGVVGGVLVTVMVVGGGVWARLYWTKRIPSSNTKSLHLAPADDTRPMLTVGGSTEASARRTQSSGDIWHKEEAMYQAVPGGCEGDRGSVLSSDDDDDDSRPSCPYTGGSDSIATVEDIFKVVVNPQRQSAAMNKIEAEETPSVKMQEPTKEADNYLGEWLQLFPKESEDKLARKLKHVSKKDEEHIGEWLQQLPQDAEDYPGGWVINSSRHDDNFPSANLNLFPKTVEEPPGGWPRKSTKEDDNHAGGETQGLPTSLSKNDSGWHERRPEGAEGYRGGALKRPQKLAESYEDWRRKYAPNKAKHFKCNTLQHSFRIAGNYHNDLPPKLPRVPTHNRGWTLPRPPNLPDNYAFRTPPNTSSEMGNYHCGMLRQPTEPRGAPTRSSSMISSSGRGGGVALRRMRRGSEEDMDLENEELPCSVHQLMYAEETIL